MIPWIAAALVALGGWILYREWDREFTAEMNRRLDAIDRGDEPDRWWSAL